MAIVGAPGLGSEAAEDRMAALFDALGDRSRLLIVRELARGDLCVKELVARLRLAQPTVSGHLAVLKRAGLLTVHQHGTQRVYSVARPELNLLLSDAGLVLEEVTVPRPPQDG